MKLFKIFAVGLILSAIVVATAIAPVINAAYDPDPPSSTEYSFSDKLFTSPIFDSSSISKVGVTLPSFPSTSTTGPTLDPPDANVTPNFSGVVVDGIAIIDGNNDDVDDLIIDENGKIFINNELELDVDGDGNPEIDVLENGYMFLGDYPAGLAILIAQSANHFHIDAYNDSVGDGYFIVTSPNVKFESNIGDVDFEIEGNLQVDGAIESADSIGSFYTRFYDSETSVTSTDVPCFSGDFLTGCSGRNRYDYAIQGTVATTETCSVYNVGSHQLYVYATCFDPDGLHEGILTYDPAYPLCYNENVHCPSP
ncbi:hypothetical protein ACFLZH_04190 [Patescibacteria group bacterium]